MMRRAFWLAVWAMAAAAEMLAGWAKEEAMKRVKAPREVPPEGEKR